MYISIYQHEVPTSPTPIYFAYMFSDTKSLLQPLCFSSLLRATRLLNSCSLLPSLPNIHGIQNIHQIQISITSKYPWYPNHSKYPKYLITSININFSPIIIYNAGFNPNIYKLMGFFSSVSGHTFQQSAAARWCWHSSRHSDPGRPPRVLWARSNQTRPLEALTERGMCHIQHISI